MEEAARRYARKILLLHLLLLVLIAAAVAIAARQVHQRAREEVIRQAARRQELLASQTARGIENYYASILGNLDLIQRGEQDEQQSRPGAFMPLPDIFGRAGGRGSLALAPLLWHQLDGRVSHLFGWRSPGRVFSVYPRERMDESQKLAEELASYLEKGAPPGETISPFFRLGENWGHLVVIPMPVRPEPAGRAGGPPDGPRGGGGNGPPRNTSDAPRIDSRVLLVAVVPVEPMRVRFLDDLNRGLASQRQFNALFLDESGVMMAGSEQVPVGVQVRPTGDPAIRELTSSGPDRRTIIYEESTSADDHILPPRMVSVEPVAVGGRKWMLVVSSRLSDLDTLVGGIFQHAFWWSIGLVVAVTAVLVSSSTQLIRSRLKIERMKNDLLDHELRQARRIQLAWLPQPPGDSSELDIAAHNEPARHISGDFYDWFELPDGRNVITIGDVTGHGLSAAFLMATTQLLIRNTMQRMPDPGQCLAEVNRQLCGQVFNGQFVTVLVLVLDLENQTLQAASAGHFPPVLTDGQSIRPLDMAGGLVLGVEDGETYPTSSFSLPDRFGLLLYTDGLMDVPSISGEYYGSKGLRQAILPAAGSAREMLEAIIVDVKRFGSSRILDDDLTMVAVFGQTAAVPASA